MRVLPWEMSPKMFMNPLGLHLPSSLDRVNPDPFSVPEKSVYLF